MPASSSAVWRTCTRLPLTAQFTGDVEQTTEIAGQQGVGPTGLDAVGFVADHTVGDVRILNAKGAAETATHFAVVEFGQGHPRQRRQQPPRLGFHPQLAQPEQES